MAAAADDRLEISVLGPTEVRVHVHGELVALGKPQVGRMVTALALGHPVAASVPVLEELLWPRGRLPAHPAQTIYTYVSNLRSALRRATGVDGWVISAPGAYGFDAAMVAVDRADFDREAEAGWAAIDLAPATALECFDRALSRWRGTPYSTLDDSPKAVGEAARLTTQRLGVLEARARLMLDTGAGADLVPGLVAAVEEHPLHERLLCSLAVALYRSGRQSESLARMRDLSDRLRDELGVDPTPETRAVELAILEHDAQVLEPVAPRPVIRRESHVARPPLVERVEREPFVGRREEMGRLADWWHGRVPMMLIRGEPGIGKSRLAAHLVATQVPRSALVVWVSADELGGGTLAALARSLLSAAAERSLEPPALARRTLDFLDDQREDTVTDSAVPGERRMLTRGRRSAIAEVLADLCASLATEYDGLVLVVDDLQWADTTTLDILDLVVTSEPPGVRVVLTSRGPDEAAIRPGVVDGWARSGAMASVMLPGLSKADVTELIEVRGGPVRGRQDPWLPARLVAETDGNAFFVTAVLGQVFGQVFGQVSGQVSGTREGSLPADVVGLVRSQLAVLGAEDREVLQVASLLGVAFTAPMLALVSGRPLPEILAALARGEEAGLLAESSEDGERWRHGLTREAVYLTLRVADRVEMHRLVAERLEAGHAGDLDPVLPALARHALIGARGGGGEVRHAVALAERAALVALERSLFREAGDLAERARALVGRPRDRTVPALLLIEMEALLCAGDLDLLGRSVDEHWSTFLRVAEPGQLAELVGYLDLMGFREPKARQILSVLPLVTSDPAAHARVLCAASLSLSVVDPDRARTMLREAWELVAPLETLGDRVRLDLLECSILVGWSFDSVGTRCELAADLARLAVTSRDLEIAALAATYERIVGYESADLALVDAATERHQRLADELRIPRYRAGARQRAAARLILEGRFADAERVATSVLEISEDEAFVAGFGAQMVAVHLEEGRLEKLDGLFEEYDAGLGGEGPWRATRVMVHASSGRLAQAREEVEAMLADGSATRPNLYLLPTLGLLAMATAETGDEAHARRLHALLAPHAARVVVVSTAAVVWGATARFMSPLDLLLGDLDAAVEHATLALSIHERLGARPFIARDRLVIATALARRDGPGDRDQAHELALGALRLAEHLGMPAVTTDARRLAESLTPLPGGKVPESNPS